jgi:MFS family permease
VIAISHLGIAACSLLLLALAGLAHARTATPIYAVLALLGSARAFAAPAQQALAPHLVPPELFSRSVAWTAIIARLSTIVGPLLAGVVYHLAGGPAPVYAASAALSIAAAALLSSIRARAGGHHDGGDILTNLVAGVRYVWSRRLILAAISLDLFAVLLGGAVALLPVYARDILAVGPGGLGLLRGATAAGAAAVALVLARHPLGKRAGAIMMVAVALFGAATIVFGLSKSFPLSLLALAVVGASDMISVVMRLTLVQIETPPEMRGRVSAVNMAFINTSNELGEFESGATAAWFGTVPSVVIGGCGTLLAVTIWSWLFPELRRADLR